MEELTLKLASALGGFAGLAFVLVCHLIGRRLLWLCEALDRMTKKDLLKLVGSHQITVEEKEAATLLLEDIETAKHRRKKP